MRSTLLADDAITSVLARSDPKVPLTVSARTDPERGAVTAEFALTLPAIVLVLALVVGGLTLSAQRVMTASVAAQIARLEARGDSAAAAQVMQRLPRGLTVNARDEGALRCVTVRARLSEGPLRALAVESHSCALRSDATPTGATP